MSDNVASCFSLGVQAGDANANEIVAPLYLALRRSLNLNCNRSYGEGLKEIAFVLRIDGKIWYWEKSGCENLRLNKSGRASIDIFMPIDIWQDGDHERILSFIKKEMTIGFFLILKRLKARKIVFDDASLVFDFEAAMKN